MWEEAAVLLQSKMVAVFAARGLVDGGGRGGEAGGVDGQ
jgi:hypothetical protein